MAMISNEFSAKHLGGKLWRSILRVGYLGITFIWLHVFFLESKSILAWFQEGVKTPPTSGAILLIIMIFVLLLRVALGISLLKKRGTQALYTPETFK
jgi:DMSO/TMAO reductase YedYZ heme-binding membrane subunit